MANEFYSVIARMGLDTTDFKRGLASIQTDAAQVQSKLGRLPMGFGRLVSVAAPIYALIRGYEGANQAAEKYQEEQKKIIENNYKILDSLTPGTEAYHKQLQSINNYRDTLTGLRGEIITAGEDLHSAFGDDGFWAALGAKINTFGRKLLVFAEWRAAGFKTTGPYALGALYAQDVEQAQKQHDDNLADISAAVAKDEAKAKAAKDKIDVAALQKKRDELSLKATDEARMEDPKNFLANVNVQLKRLEPDKDKDAAHAQEYNRLLELRDTLTKKIEEDSKKLADADQKAVDAEIKLLPISRQKLIATTELAKVTQDMADKNYKGDAALAALEDRRTELVDKLATINKQEIEDAKKIAGAKARLAEADAKEMTLAQQKLADEKELADVTKSLADGKFADADEQAALLDREAALKNDLRELDAKAVDLAAQKVKLQDDLNQKLLAHKQALIESIAPTEKEIREGKRGTGQDRYKLQQSDSLQKQAEDEYDRAQSDAEAASGNRAAVNPGALKRKSDAEFKHAADLAAQADKLRGSTGSKEALQQQVTAAEYQKGVNEIVTQLKANDKTMHGFKSSPAAV